MDFGVDILKNVLGKWYRKYREINDFRIFLKEIFCFVLYI